MDGLKALLESVRVELAAAEEVVVIVTVQRCFFLLRLCGSVVLRLYWFVFGLSAFILFGNRQRQWLRLGRELRDSVTTAREGQ